MEVLNTKIYLKNIPYKNLVLIPSIPDGSCYFHSILQAFSSQYRSLDSYQEKLSFTKKVRKEFSDYIPKVYNKLSNGLLKELSISNASVTLEYMIKELNSTNPVNEIYQELISDVFCIDIYLIDLLIGDVYTLGAPTKNLYKNRKSIFLAYNRPKFGEIGHYETVGVIREGKIETFFEYYDPFTIIVRNRLFELVNE